MAITPEQRKTVKGQGFLSNNDGEHFSGRVITENGVLNAAQLKNIAEIADRFGNGQVAFTTRLTVEIPGLDYDDIPAVKEYAAQEGMEFGGTGAKVRPVVACKGTVCIFGLIDTQAMATEIHKRFYQGYREVALPHKFKIAVGGCPNNCVKPDLNDVGVVGQRVPAYRAELCRACKKCAVEAACPMGAAKRTDAGLEIDQAVCNTCGRCIEKCPFQAIPDGEVGYRLYLGGRWGKMTRHGTKLSGLYTREEAMDMIEKVILLFKKEGRQGERFGSLLDRLGVETVERLLEGDTLLKEKEQILNG